MEASLPKVTGRPCPAREEREQEPTGQDQSGPDQTSAVVQQAAAITDSSWQVINCLELLGHKPLHYVVVQSIKILEKKCGPVYSYSPGKKPNKSRKQRKGEKSQKIPSVNRPSCQVLIFLE